MPRISGMDMLKAYVTDISAVEEAHRPFYTETDGKFVLNVTPVDGYKLEDVNGLTSALSAERTFKKEIETKLKSFEGIDAKLARQSIERVAAFGDMTPEQVAELKEAHARLSALDPAKEADKIAEEKVKTRETQLNGAFKTRETELLSQVEAAQKAQDTLKKQLKTLTVDNVVQNELAKLNPLDDARDAIQLLAEQFIVTRDTENGLAVEVLDQKGVARIKDVAGTPFSVADLLEEIKNKRPGLFKADEKSGIGLSPKNTAPSNPASTAKNPWVQGENWSMTEQMKLEINKPDLAKQLKAAAGYSDD